MCLNLGWSEPSFYPHEHCIYLTPKSNSLSTIRLVLALSSEAHSPTAGASVATCDGLRTSTVSTLRCVVVPGQIPTCEQSGAGWPARLEGQRTWSHGKRRPSFLFLVFLSTLDMTSCPGFPSGKPGVKSSCHIESVIWTWNQRVWVLMPLFW